MQDYNTDMFETNTNGNNALPTFRVGNIPVYGDAILAPKVSKFRKQFVDRLR